jgi:hypothetical protein
MPLLGLHTLHYTSHMYILYTIPSTASCLCRSVPSLIHIFLCTYSSSLYTCVYKVVVVELLDYSVVTALSELEAQAFHYTRINIC